MAVSVTGPTAKLGGPVMPGNVPLELFYIVAMIGVIICLTSVKMRDV